jgi:hypothetical protein
MAAFWYDSNMKIHPDTQIGHVMVAAFLAAKKRRKKLAT